MPRWVSNQQRRWGHTAAGRKVLGEAEVKKLDKASKGRKLPKKAKKKKG